MTLYVGDVAPGVVQFDIAQGVSGLDLTTVLGVTFKVRKPNGAEVSWSASITSATATALTAVYPLASGTSDIDMPGAWVIYALLSVPGGTLRTETVREVVSEKYGVP